MYGTDKLINIFVMHPEIKTQFESFIYRLVSYIKMGFRPRECAGIDWNEIARIKRENFALTL
jgi:hypothetical protein